MSDSKSTNTQGDSNPKVQPIRFPLVRVLKPGDTDNNKVLEVASIDYEFSVCKARTPDSNEYYRWLSKGEWEFVSE